MKQAWTLALCAVLLAPGASPHGITFPVPVPVDPTTPLPAPGPAGPAPTPATPSTPSTPTTPHVPQPKTPETPAPSQPRTGGPSGGETARPATTPRTPQVPTGAAGAAGANAIDPTSWEVWWQLNQDRFLDLKTHVRALDVRTGDEGHWLGQGTSAGAGDAADEQVVAALLGLLASERANDIVTSASVALARITDGPLTARAGEFARALSPFVNDPNQEIAETSVLARGLAGDEASAFDLTALLDDAEAARRTLGGQAVPTRTRAFAAYGLGLLCSRTANEDVRRYVVHHLVRTLRDTRGATSDVQVACVLALGLAPLSWTDKLGGEIDAPRTALAARKSTDVATASRETELEGLLALLSDPAGDRFVRAHVPGALARLSQGAGPAACREISDVLLSALAPASREPNEVVQGCVLALGHLAGVEDAELDTRVRATLQRVALGGERQARAFALIALAQRAARASETRAAAETRAFLAQRLAEGRSHERAWAALALGILEHLRHDASEPNAGSARASLLAATKDCGSPDELAALATACGLVGDTAAVPVLLTKLERTSDPRLGGHLAVALGLLGDERASGALRDLLATARFRPELLRQAAIGLALLEDRTLVPTLIETLEKAQSLAAQAAAASVIGWIGDRRAVTPLLALAAKRDATASARGFAAVALGRVCDQDRLPWNALFATDLHYRAATVTLLGGDGTGLLEIL